MDKRTEIIRKRYDRFAKIYDLMEKPMEASKLSDWRKDAIKELQGKVLEVGVGTGKNIEYYPKNLDVTGIDFSSKMLEKARRKAKKLNKEIKLIYMDAQNMDFDDNTFDSVFTTCVFCSVPDPIKGLKEIRRVCKPNGKIVMIEHVRSERKVIAALMDIFNPIVVRTFGANINRKTISNIETAGFNNIQVKDLWLDIVKKIIIINKK
ncbi:class I SAM-dependent methyltransferase [Caloranaerobacter sp. TR13]|uniref:class I SAM-dependent methyltransferase n=1 Tax=Caloranaerobacter sp. TR13 TaxID=1302151 RepID=UPI000A92912E|nr:class I SAM-dependent methyltransferase [Caloranaerobacter sp. TR13]